MAAEHRGDESDQVSAETTGALTEHVDESDEASPSRDDTVLESEWPAGVVAVLAVTRGPSVGARFALDQPRTTAGRHPSSDILLDDITVSRRHAEIHYQNNQHRIVDVGSTNGTYVNRRPVDSCALAHNDQIQIGRFRLQFLTSPTAD
jgi:FHA domain